MAPHVVDRLVAHNTEHRLPDEVADRALQEAHARWPGVALPDAAFVSYLEARLPADWLPASGLTGLSASDLYLAAGCAQGVPAALAAFEASMIPIVHQVLEGMRLPPHRRDEIAQSVRERLFVSSGDQPPKIATYRGVGTLAGWLRMVARRVAHSEIARPDRAVPTLDEVLVQLADPTEAVDLALARSRHGPQLARAIREAIAGLSARERELLRFYFVDELTVVEIGRLFGAHHSSVSRWLHAARSRVSEQVRQTLQTQLELDGAEADSLVRLLDSQLELSLQGLVGG